jgi:hypothetical protein
MASGQAVRGVSMHERASRRRVRFGAVAAPLLARTPANHLDRTSVGVPSHCLGPLTFENPILQAPLAGITYQCCPFQP